MIDLRGLRVRVETREECEKLFEMAREQGFKWESNEDLYILNYQLFPDNIVFDEERKVTWCCGYYNIEAKDIFRIKNETENTEMTAREFLERFIELRKCDDRKCRDCVFSSHNTKRKIQFCSNTNYWDKDNLDELIELVQKGDPIYHKPITESEAVNIINNLYADIGRAGYQISKDEKEALELITKKLKGEENNEK